MVLLLSAFICVHLRLDSASASMGRVALLNLDALAGTDADHQPGGAGACVGAVRNQRDADSADSLAARGFQFRFHLFSANADLIPRFVLPLIAKVVPTWPAIVEIGKKKMIF